MKKKSKSFNKNIQSSEGELKMYPSGTCYLKLKDTNSIISIYKEDTLNALPGDYVKIHYTTNLKNNVRGKVVKLIKRKTLEFIGNIQKIHNNLFCAPTYLYNFMQFKIPKSNAMQPVEGDFVKIKIKEWLPHQNNPIIEVCEIFKNYSPLKQKIFSLLTKENQQDAFPQDVLKELIKYEDFNFNHFQKENFREDFTSKICFTIDPKDAKDFDDAISYHLLNNGHVEVGIHIADVSFFITPHSATFNEALKRGCSFYFPNKVVPMLPELLSNELCSLKPNENRLALSVIVEFNANGTMVKHRFTTTIIHSKKRFAYEDVQTILEQKHGDFYAELSWLHNLTQNIRNQRFKEGAIDFQSSELYFQLTQNDEPLKIIEKKSLPAHQLIEELMLLANKLVAEYMHNTLTSIQQCPFRVHDKPDFSKFKVFEYYAQKLNPKFKLVKPELLFSQLNDFFKTCLDAEEKQILSQLAIRNMAKALYSPSNIGHYGLGTMYYCHFTSPIRRFPDLITHYLLKELILKQRTNPISFDIAEICNRANSQEKLAMQCEREVQKFLQVRFIKKCIGQEFNGIITGVAAHGCWVETLPDKCEGYFSIHHFKTKFVYKEQRMALYSDNPELCFELGKKVKVILIDANEDTLKIDFELVIQNKKKSAPAPTHNKI
ncbi:MAG: VacB/RNase II family 3'-5' exoribonuclease [Alphaproteobacteria bacterium]|nr:VacB/RNase II family 3'-5' exoribonuclease [Alphaproteobacteria bacterium]